MGRRKERSRRLTLPPSATPASYSSSLSILSPRGGALLAFFTGRMRQDEFPADKGTPSRALIASSAGNGREQTRDLLPPFTSAQRA